MLGRARACAGVHGEDPPPEVLEEDPNQEEANAFGAQLLEEIGDPWEVSEDGDQGSEEVQPWR